MRSGTNDAALLSQLFEFLIPHRPGLFSQANFCCTHAPLDDQLPAPDSLADTDRTLALRQAIAGLPADQQEILLLRYANDLPVGRVAAIVGLSRFAVGRKLRAALKRLRETLREEDFA